MLDNLEDTLTPEPEERQGPESEPTTEPATYSRASVPNGTARRPARGAGDPVQHQITSLMNLVHTLNERYEVRENVLAETVQMFRETLTEIQTTAKLWQRMIGQLDDLESGMSQSVAALVKLHRELKALLTEDTGRPGQQ